MRLRPVSRDQVETESLAFFCLMAAKSIGRCQAGHDATPQGLQKDRYNVPGACCHSSAGEHLFHPQLHFGQPMIGWDTQKKHHFSLASDGLTPISPNSYLFLSGMKGQFAYIDDILVWAANDKELPGRVDSILARVLRYGFFQCRFEMICPKRLI